MELRRFYQKIRDLEATIRDEFPVVVSKETADGGKAGITTEVPRRLAAKMVVNGIAEVANEAVTKIFRDLQADAKLIADEQAALGKVQLSVLPSTELAKLRAASKGK